MTVWIGLLAFWLEDVSPVYWIWQKLLFVLGGLMLPLDLYPEAVQRGAAFTPFPTVLAGPASFMLQAEGVSSGVLVYGMAFWSSATAFALWWIFRHARTTLAINGG
jgi:ABC-2 type transport system permease protein